MRTGLYVNFLANKRGRGVDKIMPLLSSPAFTYVSYRQESFREIREDEIEVLFVYGGDGTLHWFLTEWFNLFGEDVRPPILVPLHGGVMNVAATVLGIPSDATRAVAKINSLSEQESKKAIREVGLIKVANFNGDASPLYGLEVVLGPAINFLAEYEASPKGLWQVGRMFFLSVCSILLGLPKRFRKFLSRFECSLEVDGIRSDQRLFSVIYCSVLKRIIFGFRPFCDIHGLRGFKFLAYAALPLFIVLFLPFLAFALVPKNGKYLNTSATELRVGGFKKTIFTVDGDVYEARGSLEIRSGPKAKFFCFKHRNI